MKRAGAVIVASLGLLSSSVAWADIKGSMHDFSSQAWTGGQVCEVCHTPHNTRAAQMPLWNHGATTATFNLYSSPTLKASGGQPSGVSKACLSCHDGTVALDSFGTKTGSTTMTGPDLIGTDLSRDHPVSIVYDSALAAADHALRDPATTPSGLGGSIASDLLFGGRIECATCHDVHNAGNQAFMLRKSNAGSALCLTCHSK